MLWKPGKRSMRLHCISSPQTYLTDVHLCVPQLVHVKREKEKLPSTVERLEAELDKSSCAVAELRAANAELQGAAAAAASRAAVSHGSIAARLSEKDQVISCCCRDTSAYTHRCPSAASTAPSVPTAANLEAFRTGRH